MPRRKVAAKREILADPVFSSLLIAKFINRVMKSGKKSVAEKIVYGALAKVQDRLKSQAKKEHKDGDADGAEGSSAGSSGGKRYGNVVELLDTALDNVRPAVEVKARRVGGSTYQIPTEVRVDRRDALAMRWIIESAQSRGEKGMVLKLAGELADALEHKGGAVKKRETVHAMAKANQAFAHFAR
jgi:small subunit ribosomal protein S7